MTPRHAHTPTNETARVVALPRVVPPVVDLTSRLRFRERCEQGCDWCGRALFPIQSTSLQAIADNRGALLGLGVGWGKTAIALLAPTVLGAAFAVILTRPSLVEAMREEYDKLRRHYRLAPCLPMSYAELSQPKSTGVLGTITARHANDRVVVVMDEVHNLARLESARTKRVLRFAEEHPGVMFVGLSGTLTSRSLKQYAHLAALCLGDRSPLPRPSAKGELSAWASCIDNDGHPKPEERARLRPLWEAFGAEPVNGQYILHGKQLQEWHRRAYRSRLQSAPGVVLTEASSIGTSLVVTQLDGLTVPPTVAEPLAKLLKEGVDPRGDAMQSDDDLWRVARHLSVGFYMRWVWPNNVVDTEWLDARREWHRLVRSELRDAREGYDSPLLVWNTVARRRAAGERDFLTEAQAAWAAVKDRPEPPSVVTWLSSYYVEWIRDYVARQPGPVIVWYESRPMAAALALVGLPVYGSGTRIPEDPPGRNIAASWLVHRDGCNLQRAWSRNLVIEPPANGLVWEQMMGRTHRTGQPADEVEVEAVAHTRPFKEAIAKARASARYIEDSMGNRQKLNFCTWAKGVMT